MVSINAFFTQNFKERLIDYDPAEEEEEKESDNLNEETDDSDEEDIADIIDVNEKTFGDWIDRHDKQGWSLNNGDKVRDVLLKMTYEIAENAKKLTKMDGKTLSVIRLGLSSIIDLSSEFEGGMHTWFGQDWKDLKKKVSNHINLKIKKFEGEILSDIIKVEEFCAMYRYWDARIYLLDRLKERPSDDKHRQVVKIYYLIIDMLLENPHTFVDKEGENKQLTELEYIMKMTSPILDIIFSNNHNIIDLKWGETVSKATKSRKIDLRVLTVDSIELSHSECARAATTIKIIKDRSKCLRTNKCILDQYLMHDLSEDAVKDSTFFGLQLAGLHGQLFGIDLLDRGLYFGFDGPIFRFPAQLINIKELKNSLEDNIIKKANYVSYDNNNITRILHSGITVKPKHFKVDYIVKTYLTPKKNILKNE
ncbi:14102_t:CDS:2, partial [Entrophospora sp. SA101]